MAERDSRRRRALRQIDGIGDSMETSIKPWLVLTFVVGGVVLVWAVIDYLVNGALPQ
ncbi:MAG: hypothetical protein R3F29_01040 [Planctomycetota bacterium]